MNVSSSLLQDSVILLIVVLVSSLCGSVPFGYLIGKCHGVDIRTQGSGNIGATNVTRVIGSKWGKLCFFLDFIKGMVPVVLISILTPGRVFGCCPNSWFGNTVILADPWSILPSLAAFFAVAGHIWPCWLGFRGGKGVSTAAGAIFALNPLALISAGILWVIVFSSSHYVSLASILAAASMPVFALVFSFMLSSLSIPEIVLFTILAILTILKHTSNIRRLIHGTENRFEKGSKTKEK